MQFLLVSVPGDRRCWMTDYGTSKFHGFIWLRNNWLEFLNESGSDVFVGNWNVHLNFLFPLRFFYPFYFNSIFAFFFLNFYGLYSLLFLCNRNTFCARFSCLVRLFWNRFCFQRFKFNNLSTSFKRNCFFSLFFDDCFLFFYGLRNLYWDFFRFLWFRFLSFSPRYFGDFLDFIYLVFSLCYFFSLKYFLLIYRNYFDFFFELNDLLRFLWFLFHLYCCNNFFF
ncbi:GSCOCG00002467001-RA-CDS, partial [Cotesia congregata]